MTKITAALAAFSLFILGGANASATTIQITIENLAPAGGVFLTPVWVGFHNGSFDSYDEGAPAAVELERLAEDGNNAPIADTFGAGGTLIPTGVDPSGARMQGTLGGMPIAPGAAVSGVFDLDLDGDNQFFSYASMILTSNDYFIANANPLAHNLSLLVGGGSISFGIGLPGTVNDAGTEVNDFATAAAAGLFPGLGTTGQSGPDEGEDQNGVVMDVANPFSTFLNTPDDVDLSLLNFNDTSLYPGGVAQVTISTVVPEPTTALLLSFGAIGLAASRRRGARGV